MMEGSGEIEDPSIDLMEVGSGELEGGVPGRYFGGVRRGLAVRHQEPTISSRHESVEFNTGSMNFTSRPWMATLASKSSGSRGEGSRGETTEASSKSASLPLAKPKQPLLAVKDLKRQLRPKVQMTGLTQTLSAPLGTGPIRLPTKTQKAMQFNGRSVFVAT